jgi:hypothetical protein
MPIFELTHNISSDKKVQQIADSISPCDISYRRGDIRFFLLQFNKAKECNNLGWMILHLPPHQIFDYLQKVSNTSYLADIINQILFVFQKLGVVTTQDILRLLEFADADILSVRTTHQTLEDLTKWLLEARKKFETEMA